MMVIGLYFEVKLGTRSVTFGKPHAVPIPCDLDRRRAAPLLASALAKRLVWFEIGLGATPCASLQCAPDLAPAVCAERRRL